jgi:hypothetical protein
MDLAGIVPALHAPLVGVCLASSFFSVLGLDLHRCLESGRAMKLGERLNGAMAALLLGAFLTAVGPLSAQEADPDEWELGRVVVASEAEDVRGFLGDVSEDARWRRIPRAVLRLPRLVLRHVVLVPVEEATAFLAPRLERSGGARDGQGAGGSLGITPFGLYRSGSGLMLGARVRRSLGADAASRVALSAAFSGLDDFYLEGRYERPLGESLVLTPEAYHRSRDQRRFYGLGLGPPELETRYAFDESGVRLAVEHGQAGLQRLRLELGWSRFSTRDTARRRLGPDELALTELFAPGSVPGFGERQDFLVAGLGTRFTLSGTGNARDGLLLELRSHARAFWDAAGDGFSTLQAGAELTAAAPVFRDRVLEGRLLLEGASPLGAQVPFYLLPAIGQGGALRGYPEGRFRDRLLAVAGAEWRWLVAPKLEAAVFLDLGRVFSGLSEAGLEQWRWGSGTALRFKSQERTLFSLQAAVTAEGFELVLASGAWPFFGASRWKER